MALSVIAQPAEILTARNPVVMLLRAGTGGGNLYSAIGAGSTLSALLADRFSTTQTITVDFEDPDENTESIVFTAATVYSAIDEIPDNIFAGTDTEYWAAVSAIIGAHPRIAPFFTVTITGTVDLVIRAKSIVSGWSVSLSNTGGFSVADDTGTPDTTPPNYRVLVEVFFERSYLGGDYERVAQLESLPASDTGYMYFDLSDIVSAQCRANRQDPLVPQFGTSSPFIADNLRRYYVRYTEESGTPAAVDAWNYLEIKYVLDGGVSQSIHAITSTFGYLSDKSILDSFLTWMPDGKTIGSEQPEYLTWYNYSGAIKTITLQIVRYDVDNGMPKTPLYAYEIEVGIYESAVIPIGVDILESAAAAFGSDTYKIALRVVDSTSDFEGGDPTYLSEARTYYIDRQYYESTRYIQYLNGFGVPETWRCTGEWSKRLSLTRQTAALPLQPGYNTLATDQFQYGKTFENSFTYRTGYLRRSDAEVMQEMFIEGNIYDVAIDGYIPLRVNDSRYNITSTLEDLHAYQFEAIPRLSMRNFSKKQVSTGTSGAWMEPSTESWFDALLLPWLES